MVHHKIKVQKTAHYFTQGTISDSTQYFWVVTHGFGQLASAIMRKFEHFNNQEHFVLAPEALNRFYWDMRKGIVGASWMTKQDRLDEIEDYSNFLSQIFNEYSVQLHPNCKIILLGFSQGCATQVRWILRGLPLFHHLVLWGGLLPEDLDYQPFKEYFLDKKLHFIVGDEDEFVKQNHIDWHLKFGKEQNLNLNHILFKGKHEILTDVLINFFEREIKEIKEIKEK